MTFPLRLEGGNGNEGKGTGPVIQTGHASPFYLFAVLGLCSVILDDVSVLEGKKSTPQVQFEELSCDYNSLKCGRGFSSAF